MIRRSPSGFGRVAGMALGLGAAIAATYAVPALARFRPWAPDSGYVPFWNIIGREWMGEGERLEAEAAALEKLQSQALAAPPKPRAAPPPPKSRSRSDSANAAVFPPYAASERVDKPDVPIEWPEALDGYFRQLTLVDLRVKGAIARAGHWGDSVLGVDGITSRIRRTLQTRFGDAGHGFHMMDRYNPSYQQQDIEFRSGGGWLHCLVVQECRKRQDRRYGYGGLVVHSNGGALGTWSTAQGDFGRSASFFEIWFARQENGGDLELVVDKGNPIVINTRGAEPKDDWYSIRVPPGPHSFQVRAAGGGNVRAYGVVMENDGPGVVWDGMALIGGSSRGLRTQDPEHIAEQIRHRHANLIAFMFGGNDLERKWVDCRESMQPYYDEFGDVLTHFRGGGKEPACLIMSVLDHGKRTASDDIVSKPFVAELVQGQREVARQNGCAFYNTYAATGGEGTAARWYRSRPRLISPDLGHPNVLGYDIISGLFTNALLYAYESYRDRMAGKPLPELSKDADTRHSSGSTGKRPETPLPAPSSQDAR